MALHQNRVENIAKERLLSQEWRFRVVACEANWLCSQPTCLNARIAEVTGAVVR